MDWAGHLPDILNRLDIGLVVCDGHRLIEVNDAFCRLVGRPADQLVGNRGLPLLVPDQQQVVNSHVRRWLAGESAPRDYVTTFCHQDGHRVNCEVTTTLWGQDSYRRIVSLVRDVSARVDSEQATRQNRDREQARHRELQRLSHRLVESQEAERQHIARAIHQTASQELTGLKLLLERLEHTVSDPDRPLVAEARRTAVGVMGGLEDLALELRPTILDDLGLRPALEWLIDRLSARTGLRIELDSAGLDESPLDPRIASAAFRIVQEALTNVSRHAHAGHAQIRCDIADGRLCLVIADHGAGFDPTTATSNGVGLISVRERARALGGFLHINSTPGQGTRIMAELPTQPAVHGL